MSICLNLVIRAFAKTAPAGGVSTGPRAQHCHSENRHFPLSQITAGLLSLCEPLVTLFGVYMLLEAISNSSIFVPILI